jgi:hypothetical protein
LRIGLWKLEFPSVFHEFESHIEIARFDRLPRPIEID